MTRTYELMVILSPEVDLDAVPARMQALRDLVAEHGGAVTDVVDWGRRRLAYRIDTHFEGHYLIAQYTLQNGGGNTTLRRVLNIDESVLRHLIVRKDE